MNELIKGLAANVGIPSDKAKMAIEFMLAHFKQNLPAPIASQIETLVNKGTATTPLAAATAAAATAAPGLGAAIGGMAAK